MIWYDIICLQELAEGQEDIASAADSGTSSGWGSLETKDVTGGEGTQRRHEASSTKATDWKSITGDGSCDENSSTKDSGRGSNGATSLKQQERTMKASRCAVDNTDHGTAVVTGRNIFIIFNVSHWVVFEVSLVCHNFLKDVALHGYNRFFFSI